MRNNVNYTRQDWERVRWEETTQKEKYLGIFRAQK